MYVHFLMEYFFIILANKKIKQQNRKQMLVKVILIYDDECFFFFFIFHIVCAERVIYLVHRLLFTKMVTSIKLLLFFFTFFGLNDFCHFHFFFLSLPLSSFEIINISPPNTIINIFFSFNVNTIMSQPQTCY